MSSGLPGLDTLLGGGVPAGSTTLLVGPAGSGKSSTATQFAFHNLKQGEKVTIYTFDETVESYLIRAAEERRSLLSVEKMSIDTVCGRYMCQACIMGLASPPATMT